MHKITGALPLSKDMTDYDILIDEGQQSQQKPQDVHATLKTSSGQNKEIKVKVQPATYRIKLPKTLENYPKKPAVIISVLHLIVGVISVAIYVFTVGVLRNVKIFSNHIMRSFNFYMLFGNELWSGLVFVVAGILGCVVCCTSNKKVAIAFAVTNVNSAVFAFYSFAFLVKDIHFVVMSRKWDYFDKPDMTSEIIAVNSLIAIMLLFEFAVSIYGSVIFNRVVCEGTRKSIEVEMDDPEST